MTYPFTWHALFRLQPTVEYNWTWPVDSRPPNPILPHPYSLTLGFQQPSSPQSHVCLKQQPLLAPRQQNSSCLSLFAHLSSSPDMAEHPTPLLCLTATVTPTARPIALASSPLYYLSNFGFNQQRSMPGQTIPSSAVKPDQVLVY